MQRLSTPTPAFKGITIVTARMLSHQITTAIIAIVSLVGSVFAASTEPVVVSTETRQTPDGPVVLYIARIELTNPSIEVVVTNPVDPNGTTPEAVLTPTTTWAETTGTLLAVNANFFAKLPKPSPHAKNPPIGNSDIVGLSISDGFIVSPVREFKGNPDPALVFAKDGSARMGRFGFEDLVDAWDAVAGISSGDATTADTGLLVTDGKNTSISARVEPAARHPRTAAAISRNGAVMWLVVADGRQPDRSVGLTLPELADILIELGADDAINLDGGGSSSFVYSPPGADKVVNTPSEGAFRPVANHLGIRIRKEPVPAPTPEPAPK